MKKIEQMENKFNVTIIYDNGFYYVYNRQDENLINFIESGKTLRDIEKALISRNRNPFIPPTKEQ